MLKFIKTGIIIYCFSFFALADDAETFVYKPSENEIKLTKIFIDNDVALFFRGQTDVLMSRSFVKELHITAVTANKLQSDYAANEARGDKNYKGKQLYINGVVKKIGSGADGKPYVVLKSAKALFAPQLKFASKYEHVAAELNKGDKIDFICEGAGVVVGTPILAKCLPLENQIENVAGAIKKSYDEVVNGAPLKKGALESRFAYFVRIAAIQSNDFKDHCTEVDMKCFYKAFKLKPSAEQEQLFKKQSAFF